MREPRLVGRYDALSSRTGTDASNRESRTSASPVTRVSKEGVARNSLTDEVWIPVRTARRLPQHEHRAHRERQPSTSSKSGVTEIRVRVQLAGVRFFRPQSSG